MGRLKPSEALTWLAQNQIQDEGKWPAWSLNKKRDPKSDVGHFMNDAATASRCWRLRTVTETICMLNELSGTALWVVFSRPYGTHSFFQMLPGRSGHSQPSLLG